SVPHVALRRANVGACRTGNFQRRSAGRMLSALVPLRAHLEFGDPEREGLLSTFALRSRPGNTRGTRQGWRSRRGLRCGGCSSKGERRSTWTAETFGSEVVLSAPSFSSLQVAKRTLHQAKRSFTQVVHRPSDLRRLPVTTCRFARP